MARYTCFFTVALPIDNLRQSLVEILESCNFDMIYDTGDYMMAREVPGQVPFAKLVTVELLIDKTKATPTELQMNLVMKNEELPLQLNNHCRQMFDLVSHAIAETHHWQVIESVAG
ncbi:hypothetical protein H6G20_25745 [Desertifilum sp. FACHB-1129]|uniref:Uncharacterized protein n=2 Tax=Desertifilum tharense IPPAS B-1220 TaxID=1781255 RepID=A0A1E5QG24_9CYAN|nr:MULTISPECIES: hypothetical protein [Desertifilum]MCD8486763.1 hypothetical protein [Desertifilum sp.]MDA0209267.1 hypothetical protein [Cyanobacteria bacterium FC1]NES97211.1 hypothetical protein [Desertifilum sp. SIO1I2]MBD2315074.1 hypothetical protein [Desertifilum sp. FACHB-1129]MBD2323336.1 hypothetical protein [Desertifilum sp. FACHB-866]